MRLEEFDYELPEACIAQRPASERAGARLLRLDRATGALSDHRFTDLPGLLRPGDVAVANDTKVFPARLLGRRRGPGLSPGSGPGDGDLGAAVEVLLLEDAGSDGCGRVWEALVRPGRRMAVGARIEFGPGFAAEVVGRGGRGARRLRFESEGIEERFERYGHVPLPPYIRRPDEAADRERYQTVFARERGSAAAPTAGLHFNPEVLAALAARGVAWHTVTLHIGAATFQPVVAGRIEEHAMHAERYHVGAAAAAAVRMAKAEGRRVIAIGTTAARALESAAATGEPSGETRLFLYPGGPGFRVVDGLLTNFHAPRTSLLMMVAVLAGLEPMRRAYRHALQSGYRFLSYGDCMLIL